MPWGGRKRAVVRGVVGRWRVVRRGLGVGVEGERWWRWRVEEEPPPLGERRRRRGKVGWKVREVIADCGGGGGG